MPDVVDQQTRSRMMAGIRGTNTAPEMLIRRALHARGFRYRIHAKDVPGKPDLVLPRFHAAIFVHGCFWHGHDCSLFKLPGTRPDFWQRKIEGNRLRDEKVAAQLKEAGWRQLTVWECSMRGPGRMGIDAIIDDIVDWLIQGQPSSEIRAEAA